MSHLTLLLLSWKLVEVVPRPKLRAACFHLCWQKGQISSCRQEYLWWTLDQHGPEPVGGWGLCDRELQTHSILQKNRAKNILKTIHHPKDTKKLFFFQLVQKFHLLFSSLSCMLCDQTLKDFHRLLSGAVLPLAGCIWMTSLWFAVFL